MPIMKFYHHGLTAGIQPTKNSHMRAKRDVVQGWTAKTARANTRFLRSVDVSRLDGTGFAFTLTLKDCPPTHDDWKRLREAYLERLRKLGRLRVHWVTEWQRRGVPHLHGLAYFPGPMIGMEYVKRHRALRDIWCRIAAPYGAGVHGQHVAPITDTVGWLQYLAKHASRGASHYQRSGENIPPGWRGRTGRMWGKTGDWPIDEPMALKVDNEGYYAFRRIVRAWRTADARAEANPTRIRQARQMLKCGDEPLSRVRGISEWIPEDLSLLMLAAVSQDGHEVEQVS